MADKIIPTGKSVSADADEVPVVSSRVEQAETRPRPFYEQLGIDKKRADELKQSWDRTAPAPDEPDEDEEVDE